MPGPPARTPRLTPQSLSMGAHCVRKLWLHQHQPAEAAPADEHLLVLRERADAHQRAVAARFTDLAGPVWRRDGPFRAAAEETLRLLRESRRPIQRPAFLTPDGSRSCAPDFVWWDDDVLVVQDVRLALRPETRSDFALQHAHHRAVIRDAAGIEPGRFEIVNGYGETVVIDPAPEAEHATASRVAASTLAAAQEPDLLLSHSACRACDFYSHCWDRAEHERRIEILPEVQTAHVPAYHAAGVRTLAQLADLDPARPPAGPPAGAVRRAVIAAAAWRDDRAVWLSPPRLPEGPLVWFDLEGDSRGEDAEIPIYLWGFALETAGAPPAAEAIVAELVAGGDALAWGRFVTRASTLLDAHAGVRWVHWDHYEPLWVRRYADRHGAPAGFPERLIGACFDLKRVLDRCVRLPLRSYSIKHVARRLGFAWRDPDSGSEWSVAQFHRASASTDAGERARRFADLARYNEDDLLAMRRIWRWMLEEGPR